MEFLASQFALHNCIPAKNGRKCISGRYPTNDTNSGMIARPGADFGYIMAMLSYNHEQKLGLSIEECVQRVYSAVIALDGNFYMHTDDQEDTAVPHSIGCSYALSATYTENAGQFGLQAEDVQKALAICKTDTGLTITMTKLSGDHTEEGILIIKDEDHTVHAQDTERMYYIYDKKRDDIFMRKLVEELGMENIIYEDFQRISTMQFGIMLQLLAKGLPLYEVDFIDPAHPFVKHIGTV